MSNATSIFHFSKFLKKNNFFIRRSHNENIKKNFSIFTCMLLCHVNQYLRSQCSDDFAYSRLWKQHKITLSHTICTMQYDYCICILVCDVKRYSCVPNNRASTLICIQEKFHLTSYQCLWFLPNNFWKNIKNQVKWFSCLNHIISNAFNPVGLLGLSIISENIQSCSLFSPARLFGTSAYFSG